jgi:hypothetical protein
MEDYFQENEANRRMHYVSQRIVIKQEEDQVEDKHLDSRRPTLKHIGVPCGFKRHLGAVHGLASKGRFHIAHERMKSTGDGHQG